MPSARVNQRIKLALKDDKAAEELIDFLDAIDPDGDGAVGADAVTYDGTGSGLTATDVQAAIDEVVTDIGALEGTDIAYAGGAGLVGADLDTVLDNIGTAIQLSAGVEALNVIQVAVQGVAAVRQYRATLFTNAMIPELAAAFTMTENGPGANVSAPGNPSLLFTTNAAGQATLDVTDVAGASSLQTRLVVEPVPDQGSVIGSAPGQLLIGFDGV